MSADSAGPEQSAPVKVPQPPRRSGRVQDLEAQMQRLRERLRIAVIYGGDKSNEGAVIHQTANPRSWKSYQSVAQDIADALQGLGFRHTILVPDDMRLGEVLRRDGTHLAWLNTGGVQGYNPMCHASAMLEMLGIPYVGHDPLTVGRLDNKHTLKHELLYLDIPTAPFITWHLSRGPFRPNVNSRFIQTFKNHWGPFVVKPVSGRASLHVHLVETQNDLTDAVAEVYQATGNHVLIETYLPGREFCVAVHGLVVAQDGKLLRRSDPFTFATIERVLGPDEPIFTSMDVQPITMERVHVLDLASEASELAQLQELGRRIFVELNLECLVRLDVRRDSHGNLNVLEVNPKPDLKKPRDKEISLVCADLARHGMSYDDLILSMIADRLDLLFSQRRGTVIHLAELME